jgi:hypothetical protein
MNRRSLLQFIGIAPLVTVMPVAAIAQTAPNTGISGVAISDVVGCHAILVAPIGLSRPLRPNTKRNRVLAQIMNTEEVRLWDALPPLSLGELHEYKGEKNASI